MPRPPPRLQDYANGFLYGLEKLWAFHNYHGFPKGSSVQMNPKVGVECAGRGRGLRVGQARESGWMLHSCVTCRPPKHDSL